LVDGGEAWWLRCGCVAVIARRRSVALAWAAVDGVHMLARRKVGGGRVEARRGVCNARAPLAYTPLAIAPS